MTIDNAAADQRDKNVWIGLTQHRISQTHNPSHWSAVSIIADQLPNMPKTEGELRHILNMLRYGSERSYLTFSHSRTPSDTVEDANLFLEQFKQLPNLSAMLFANRQHALKNYAESSEWTTHFWSAYNKEFASNWAYFDIDKAGALGKIYDWAQGNPIFAKVWDEVYAPIINARIQDRANSILAENQDFAAIEGVKLISSENADVKSAVEKLSNSLSEMKLKNTQEDKDAVAQPDDIVKILMKQQKDQSNLERSEFEREGIRSAVFLTSLFFSDKKESQRFVAVGNAIIDVIKIADTYERLYTSGPGAESASSVGTAAMTMNYFAIFVSLVQTMEDTGPTGDQIISAQIVNLAKQMEAYQKENRARFDRIDAELSQIFAEMVSQFSNAANQIALARADLSEIRGAMAQTLTRLDHIERRLVRYLEVIAAEPFEGAMKKCVGVAKAIGIPLTETEYAKCTLEISRFLDLARSEPLAGTWKVGSKLTDIDIPLEERDWSAAINVFLGLAQDRGGFPFSARRANPLRWTRAADAYIRLAVENDAFFKSQPSAILDSLVNEGVSIESDLTKRFVEQPEKFLTLLDSMMAEHLSAVQRVERSASEIRQKVLLEMDATAVWLSPSELSEIANRLLPDFSKRDVVYAADWPVLSTEWNKIQDKGRGWNRKSGAQGKYLEYKPLVGGPHIWKVSLNDPTLIAAELVGLGQLAFRYAPDVLNPESLSDQAVASLVGEPIVSVFAYLLPKGKPTPEKPLAIIDYRKGWKQILYFQGCNRPANCKYMKNFGGDRQKQFDWVTFLETENTLANPLITRSPLLTKQVETRLDELLVRQNQELIRELERPDSPLHIAVHDLETIALAIRGLTALTLPGPSLYQDGLRSVVLGVPESKACLLTSSRVQIGTSSVTENSHFKDPMSKLDVIPEVKPKTVTNEDGFKPCTSDEIEPESFPFLIDSRIVRRFVTLAVGSSQINPDLIDNRSLLVGLSSLADSGRTALFSQVSRAIERTKKEPNIHPSISFFLSRLHSLKLAKEQPVARAIEQ
ncbi:hypothetical protein CIT31_02660 [Mesorhizobium wenxiniae]|uniref:Uncharacterized protein n=1 Tax=Mesorhizobium wenxiniae TaxID=2014805 RepID=A0A271KLE9_9HYPH|nr:hypothetical protein CIT31_02660 [Mesorhizobium wenxiniae]